MKTIATALLLTLLSFNSLSQQRTIPRLTYADIDGHLKEWHNVPGIVFSSNDSTPGVFDEGRKPFDGINDLHVNLKLAWNDDGLFAAIEWRDDVIDTRRVSTRAEARWEHPSGNGARDGMYFSDNIVLRIQRGDNYYYGNWMSPMDQNPHQWQLLRLGPQGTAYTETDKPIMTSRRVENGKVLIEAFWSWEMLHFKPRANEIVKIRIIPTDADQPGIPFEIKERNVKYMHLYKDFIFRN